MDLKTEEVSRPRRPEEKLAHAILARAVEDIKNIQLIMDGKLVCNSPNSKLEHIINGIGAIKFIFREGSCISAYWFLLAGINQTALQRGLAKRHPWILREDVDEYIKREVGRKGRKEPAHGETKNPNGPDSGNDSSVCKGLTKAHGCRQDGKACTDKSETGSSASAVHN